MDLQPGVYGIKRHVPGQFMSIESLPQQQPEQPSLGEGAEDGGVAGGEAEAGRVGGRVGAAAAASICRGAAGRTLEFACGNLFDVPNLAKVTGVEGGLQCCFWGERGT